jgi:hypothetical protein
MAVKATAKDSRLFTLADLAVLTLCFIVLAPVAAQQDDAPLPAPTASRGYVVFDGYYCQL